MAAEPGRSAPVPAHAKRDWQHAGVRIPPGAQEALRSAGQPLDSATRAFMEPRFGQDFSQVRVHTDGQAAQSAREVNALAYTLGQDVVFGTGQHAPRSAAGQELIAHELTHVIQQSRAAGLQPKSMLSQPGDASEREADAVAASLVSEAERPIPSIHPAEAQISRKAPSNDPLLSEDDPARFGGGPLPFREATELSECIRIMGKANMDYCRHTVLHEPYSKPASPPGAMSVNPTEVQPRTTGGTETATVSVTNATPGEKITPVVTATANSGGHQHANARTVGTITPANRPADAAGRADFTYRSNLPGGVETVSASAGGSAVQANIDVRVPGLADLPASANYDLVGQTTNHPINHFGAAATITSLQTIATNYEALKTANKTPGWPRLAYNDISLERGGIFDISGGWAPPHITHRVGATVDFRINQLNAAQRAAVRPIITAAGASILNEGDHWHLTF